MQLLAAAAARGDEAGVFQHAQVLHHAEASHLRQLCLELGQGLAVALVESVEQQPPVASCEGAEDLVHPASDDT
ncbi:MAG TPA: hypothetical protein VFZ12_09515 [Dehalococcoidia bacterium]|nr:hypothetical protein [Dehalococcoidia bacterium]